MSPDAEWHRRYGIIDIPERLWRVFPTPEIQKKWLIELCLKEHRLEEVQEWLKKSDAEHISGAGGYWRNTEDEIRRFLPQKRREWEQQIEELPLQIKNLEEEFASNRVWKNLNLGPAQQEIIRELLLGAYYAIDQVKVISGANSQNQFISEAKTQKLTVSPGTHWEDIKITLISDEMVRIKTPNWEKRLTYHQLGFADKRRGDKPNMLWTMLKIFAKKNGFISSQNTSYHPTLPDSAKRLNRHLQEIFSIKETIYKAHYKKEKGYRTKIIFSDQALTF